MELRWFDHALVRELWRDWYRPMLRDRFSVIEGRPVTDAEVDRWAPFEAVVAMGPMGKRELVERLSAYAQSRVAAREWTNRYWWPWTELDDWGVTP